MSAVDNVDIATEYGPVRGCKKTSLLGLSYYSFQRIPYMKPPVGKLRFTDPQPPEKWTVPLDCTKEGSPFCNVNFLNGQYEGELDAMFINIYTNNIEPSKPYPVMVWIHGGGIFTGSAASSMYGPDYLMQKNALVVTFQYRMGVFGFLSLDDPSLNIPGNAQFRDHIFALKWIKANISRFGGDPDNITLFGESWGGGSTNYHMISEKSKGLFHRAILMSGTALNTVYSLIPRRQWAQRLCEKLGYDGPMDDKSLLEFLEISDPKEMVMTSPKLFTPEEMLEDILTIPFGPTIEPFDNGNIFLSDEIVKMAKNCWGNDIDILIGATSNEMASIEILANVEEEWKKYISINRYVPIELNLNWDDERRSKYAKMVLENYYGKLYPTKTNLEGLMHLVNDNVLWHPASRIIRSRANSGQAGKSFVYRFDYDSENNLFKKFLKISDKIREPMHGDDVFYIFKSEMGPAPAIESLGFEGMKLMLSVLYEFAATGNPNVKELGEGVHWEPATIDDPLRGININEKNCEFIELPEAERSKIFDKIFIDCGKDLF